MKPRGAPADGRGEVQLQLEGPQTGDLAGGEEGGFRL